MGRWDGQVAWITGGGSGIGAAVARALATGGARVAVSGRRRDALDAVVDAITAGGGQALAVPCDVTVDAQVEAAVSTVIDHWGALDLVVASAGYAAIGRVETTDAAVWRKQLEVNVLGLVSTARHALPELRRAQGRLVLVGSVAAFLPVAGQGPYVASKAAVDALGATLSVEVAGTGVSVTTVHPGFVATDIVQRDALGRWVGGRKDARPGWLLAAPDTIARDLLDAAWRRQRQVVLTGHGKLAAWLGRHAPGLVHGLLTARARPVAPTPRPSELGVLPRATTPSIRLARDLGFRGLFTRALVRAAQRSEGVLPPGGAFPDLRVTLDGVTVPRRRVRAYREVCGAPGDDDVLPLAMPEILFLGLMGTIATHEAFPISPFGLIHVGQTITGHRPVRADAPLALAAHLAEARRTERGLEVDLHLTASDDDGLVWEAVTTLLSRRPGIRRGKRRERETTPPEDGTQVEVPEATGRDYARVSGDWNPHHLWALTARPLGYGRPIAHGMWTLARVLADLPGGEVHTGWVTARFRRPIPMPGTVALAAIPEGGGAALHVWHPRTGAPHLDGRWEPEAPDSSGG